MSKGSSRARSMSGACRRLARSFTCVSGYALSMPVLFTCTQILPPAQHPKEMEIQPETLQGMCAACMLPCHVLLCCRPVAPGTPAVASLTSMRDV